MERIQFEAIWCMTNIASSESQYVLKLVDCGAIKTLIKLLDVEVSITVKEQAIWCLGNIAGDSHLFRDSIVNEGAIDKISVILSQAPPETSLVRNASWTLANFGKGKPMIKIKDFTPAIFTLTKILNENTNEDVLSDIVWAFSYVTDEGGDETILPFIQADLAPRLL